MNINQALEQQGLSVISGSMRMEAMLSAGMSALLVDYESGKAWTLTLKDGEPSLVSFEGVLPTTVSRDTIMIQVSKAPEKDRKYDRQDETPGL